MKRGEPPEATLLLLCARHTLGPDQREAVEALLTGTIDWDHLLRLAERHGLAPLLHRHLGTCTTAAIPSAVVAWLWARHEARARRNHELAAELVAIVKHLDAHGLKVVPYKGPTLAMAAYGDLAQREFGDLDLLVRAGDAIAVKDILVSRGYVPDLLLSPCQEEALVRSRRHYELPLRDTSRRMLVELHWRSDPEFEVARLEDPQWWRELGAIEVCGATVPALPARELLLVLCLHGTKHFWFSLGWLVDAAELMRRASPADWAWILATARRLGAARHLGVGLKLASDLLQAPVPEAARAIVEDREVVACAQRIRAGLFDPGYRPWTLGQSLRENLRLHSGVWPRLRYLAWMGLTPGVGEWQRWRLPPALFPLYWPLRAVRLAQKYVLGRG